MIQDNFLLSDAKAQQLYHDYAADLPIIDYHNHLDVHAIASDRMFGDITELWVAADPYKHRAMRLTGVPERYITGDATAREKFDAWAKTLPKALGNPLCHWSSLELKRYFDIDEPLDGDSAEAVWNHCNDALRKESYSSRKLLSRYDVTCICTSDALLDDLHSHAKLAASDFSIQVRPSLRADDALNIASPTFKDWLTTLSETVGEDIRSFEDYCGALAKRLDYFHSHGCKLADHGLDVLRYVSITTDEAEKLFQKCLMAAPLQEDEQVHLRSAMLRVLASEYAQRGWVMQLHLGAQRFTSTRLRHLAGPAGGYATIGNACDVPSLCQLFDDLEQQGRLPRTILYPLNPNDYAKLGTLTGSFSEDGIAGKIQLGPAWWFNDHSAGMIQHLQAISNYSLLSTFMGMTTDSRSILSMSRHEYFRRVLCHWLASQIDEGQLPNDLKQVGQLVRAIAYDNTHRVLFQESEVP